MTATDFGADIGNDSMPYLMTHSHNLNWKYIKQNLSPLDHMHLKLYKCSWNKVLVIHDVCNYIPHFQPGLSRTSDSRPRENELWRGNTSDVTLIPLIGSDILKSNYTSYSWKNRHTHYRSFAILHYHKNFSCLSFASYQYKPGNKQTASF